VYSSGWYQLAFERDLDQITPVTFGNRSLMILKSESGVRITDATCPHRGANLAYGGRVVGEYIRCPFHGYKIGIGEDAQAINGLFVKEYPACVIGGMVLVALDDASAPDLPGALQTIGQDHGFVSGFELAVNTNIEMVMENGFDPVHFRVVHSLLMEPRLDISETDRGALQVTGEFSIPRSTWNSDQTSRAPVKARYTATAYSPGVVIAELSGEEPYNYQIITTAVPAADYRSCTIRLNVALPLNGNNEPDGQFAASLLESSREGLKMDCAIWDHLDQDHQDTMVEADAAALAFAEFTRGFRQ
jgi:3-ketosteroid 9alpha-monooxygenase subunit A